MKYARLVGTGSYLPEKVLTNADLEKMVDTSDEWIKQRTGIERRHIVAKGETSSSMGEIASRQAIEAAGLTPDDIDMIIFATTTPDAILPIAGCSLQHRLGIPGIPTFDLSAACAGFLYSMAVADQFIRSGNMQHILVVGAEVMSSVVDWEDRNTCVLFGDGAGAAVFSASDEPGILSTHLHANGDYKDILRVPSSLPGQADPAQPAYVNMEGKEVFKFAVNALSDAVDEALSANDMQKSDIDWLIPHQANIRIIAATAKKLNLPMERVVLTVQDQGNTSAASIPLALDKGVRSGNIKPGETLLFEAIGGGMVWGSALVKY
ncbi:MAG: 3-oxoacyl-ACP synthase [Legionellales bacterium]|nr:3-oxoacyl-ACP synthase [Legionellales bacterium]|tara:strand:+ start:2485 stop:3447 length:963 start_codon:yes stop_codon:yes gene_type:complete